MATEYLSEVYSLTKKKIDHETVVGKLLKRTQNSLSHTIVVRGMKAPSVNIT